MTEMYQKPGSKRSADKPEWQGNLCKFVITEWDKGQSFTSDLNELYDDLYEMLRGGRPNKTYDWQSDLSLRKAFQVVWTMISYVSQKIWGAEPVIGVEGFNKKGCWQREMLLQTWMAQDKYFLTLVHGLLRLGLNGVVIVKKGWKQVLQSREQERTIPVWDSEGQMVYRNENVRYTIPLKDHPEDTVLNNKNVVVDWMLRPGQMITEGRFIIHRETVDIASLYASPINYMNLDDVPHGTLQSTDEHADKPSVRQQDDPDSPPESDIYAETEIFERQGVFPVKVKKNGDVIPLFDKKDIYKEDTEWRHMIVTIADKKNPVLVRWEDNPYGEMGYVSGHMYLDPERWQSQGIVEPAKDVFGAMDDNLNASFDEIWKNLMPPVIFNKHMVQDWDTIKWAPGQKWMMQGNPSDNVMITRGTEITRDAWQKHMLLDDEGRLITSVMPGTQGNDKSKTATQGVINTQFSTGKLDFLIRMIEVTWLIPSVQMTMRFAQQFAHPLTFIAILGEHFRFDQWQEEYKYIPSASSVKLPEQKETEIQQDIQLIQVAQGFQNPNTAKVVNYFLANIIRNRGYPQVAELYDEGFFEPSSDSGNFQMIERQLGQGASNEYGLPMSPQERGMRQRTFEPRGLMQ
ncbi:MAG: hypothetical protein RTU92_01075 [Candidatus Thorarchaeota archaeon]